MSRELDAMMLMRRVFVAAGEEMGVAGALVRIFAATSPEGTRVARLTLLGFPPRYALEPFVSGKSREVAMLASLLVSASKGSTSLVGKKGELLSTILERWIKAEETRKMELRVLRFRGFVISAVMGAVLAMLSSLGPLVTGLDLTGKSAPAPPVMLSYATSAMAALSSLFLGIFMSGRSFIVNVVITLATFALVTAAAAPLVSVATVDLWAIK